MGLETKSEKLLEQLYLEHGNQPLTTFPPFWKENSSFPGHDFNTVEPDPPGEEIASLWGLEKNKQLLYREPLDVSMVHHSHSTVPGGLPGVLGPEALGAGEAT